jgi:hypothetical protein
MLVQRVGPMHVQAAASQAEDADRVAQQWLLLAGRALPPQPLHDSRRGQLLSALLLHCAFQTRAGGMCETGLRIFAADTREVQGNNKN